MRLPCDQRHAHATVHRQPLSRLQFIHVLHEPRESYCKACRATAHPKEAVPAKASRRQSLWAALAAGVSLQGAASSHALTTGEVLQVGGGGAFGSIGDALAAAPDGALVRVAPGMYMERLLISKRVSIRAGGSGPVTLAWSTSEPYQSAVESPGLYGASISGLNIRHRSPSVANNYAVFLQGSDLVLQDCDISSSTGSGVGIEGGSPQLTRCAVHNCERHGIAIFSELGGSAGGGSIQDCRISANKLNGVLVRDEAEPVLSGNVIQQNGDSGISLKGCGGRYMGNSIAGNGRGPIAIDALADVDLNSLRRDNELDKPVTLM